MTFTPSVTPEFSGTVTGNVTFYDGTTGAAVISSTKTPETLPGAPKADGLKDPRLGSPIVCGNLRTGMSRLLWSRPKSRADGRIRCVIVNT